jgi:hypothetical protein
MDHASPMVCQDDEDEQHLERHRGHGEEVHGDQAPEVVVEEVCRAWASGPRKLMKIVLG